MPVSSGSGTHIMPLETSSYSYCASAGSACVLTGENDRRPMSPRHEPPPSDLAAVDAICSVRPAWSRQRTASEALGLQENAFLHAGPAFRHPADICQPVLNSACCAAIYEGLARDFRQAEAMILSREIELSPAQNRSTVVPLAGVVSSSMQLHEIFDRSNPRHRAYAPINGGSGPAMRLGQRSIEVIEHLRWLNGMFNDSLSRLLESDIDLISVASHALKLGDDCHGRTPAATSELIRILQPGLGSHQKAHDFLQGGPSFFLNLWMAACKCMLSAANGVEGSSIVTAAAGNGAEFGIQVAGDAGVWHCTPASPPVGDLGAYAAARALGAIGDSAIVDIAGFGAMAMSFAPAQQQALKSGLPNHALQLPKLLLSTINPQFSGLSFRTALSSRLVRKNGVSPIVSLGILDSHGEAGRIGGGIYQLPCGVFDTALERIESHPAQDA